MTKPNLWQIITGMVVTAICGVTLNMGVFSFFPALIVAIAWAGSNRLPARNTRTRTVTTQSRSSGRILYP